VELVFYTAVADFITSVGFLIGNNRYHTWRCFFQAMFTNYGFLASALWTTVMAYEIFLIIKRKAGLKDLIFCHIVCWIFPLICQIVIIFSDSDGDGGWCLISNDLRLPTLKTGLYQILTVFMWIWLLVIINGIIVGWVVYHLRRYKDIIPREARKALIKLLFYPITLLVCWICPSVLSIYAIVKHVEPTNVSDSYVPKVIARISPVFQGFLLCMIFLSRRGVRKIWLNFLYGITNDDDTKIVFSNSITSFQEAKYKDSECEVRNPTIPGLWYRDSNESIITSASGIESKDESQISHGESGVRLSTLSNL
jgi:hypothetical protein